MPRINCKCCGCPNEVEQGKFVVVCEACGSEQAITNLDSEKKTNLFNRANAARLKCDFDKALSNYEQILIDYPNDAEAHWGIVLCRYGIEYVDDPKTNKKIPTCHRTIYQAVFDDIDYKDAISNADVVAKKVYQDEAERIDRIQKSIIAISQKEQPYDIFICYKETDDSGNRTRDSFVAEDIYTELINKGYKVFYSRITLESKLGQQYEPIIFAALQSARVMLVIGSKKEYFEAVWVKNEWSRYLSFMAENKASKYMIPCYRDMEAYDMPDEFLSLQSQNLDRLGAKQDLLRAIDKVFGKDNNEKKIEQNNETHNQEENYLKRARLFYEDNDYENAELYCDKVLDLNPENAYAYEIMLLIDTKNLSMKFVDNKYYKKVIQFGDEELINKYKNIRRIEEEKTYNIAKSVCETIDNQNDSSKLQSLLEDLSRLSSEYNISSLVDTIEQRINMLAEFSKSFNLNKDHYISLYFYPEKITIVRVVNVGLLNSYKDWTIIKGDTVSSSSFYAIEKELPIDKNISIRLVKNEVEQLYFYLDYKTVDCISSNNYFPVEFKNFLIKYCSFFSIDLKNELNVSSSINNNNNSSSNSNNNNNNSNNQSITNRNQGNYKLAIAKMKKIGTILSLFGLLFVLIAFFTYIGVEVSNAFVYFAFIFSFLITLFSIVLSKSYRKDNVNFILNYLAGLFLLIAFTVITYNRTVYYSSSNGALVASLIFTSFSLPATIAGGVMYTVAFALGKKKPSGVNQSTTYNATNENKNTQSNDSIVKNTKTQSSTGSTTANTSTIKKKYCRKCGMDFVSSQIYCPECGNKLEDI